MVVILFNTLSFFPPVMIQWWCASEDCVLYEPGHINTATGGFYQHKLRILLILFFYLVDSIQFSSLRYCIRYYCASAGFWKKFCKINFCLLERRL